MRGHSEGVIAACIGAITAKYTRAAACAICFTHEIEQPIEKRKSQYASGPLFDKFAEFCDRIASGSHPPMRSMKVTLSVDDPPDLNACIREVIHEPVEESYNVMAPDWGP